MDFECSLGWVGFDCWVAGGFGIASRWIARNSTATASEKYEPNHKQNLPSTADPSIPESGLPQC
ncbi:hypothetical protein DM826_02005 [Halonotius aquaticus]|uniref:Uncharacterized protein n=1 Tax=Halonotius aquaticus TaxID=2216978 RepID=A0A3A6Q6A0_9EURY|nr:hypothetical protein DM826_02005 [Halonotius aquaticus]